MQNSKICKKNHNSCPVFPIRTRKNPFGAFINYQGESHTNSWQAYQASQGVAQTFEQAQARSVVLGQVQKIDSISGLSASFWKDVLGTPFSSMEELMEPYYDLAEEFYKEALVLKEAVKEFLHALQKRAC